MSLASPAVTILVDNQAGAGLAAEHGLALWIEVEDRRILFDTGQGPALPINARALGVDLGATDWLVLSHGHYDHTGGVRHLLMAAPRVQVYCHPGVVQPRYSRRDGSLRAIQMPGQDQAALDRLPDTRLHWISEATRLTDAIGLTGPIPRLIGCEDTGGAFFRDPEARRPDPIDDDLAMWIRTDKGLVVCVGCCHAGVINTLRHIRRLCPNDRIRAVIGGFHLLNADRRRLAQTVAAMARLPIEVLIPCHCTGHQAIRALEDALGKKVRPGASGMVHRF